VEDPGSPLVSAACHSPHLHPPQIPNLKSESPDVPREFAVAHVIGSAARLVNVVVLLPTLTLSDVERMQSCRMWLGTLMGELQSPLSGASICSCSM
jgi:hypothetical protein